MIESTLVAGQVMVAVAMVFAVSLALFIAITGRWIAEAPYTLTLVWVLITLLIHYVGAP